MREYKFRGKRIDNGEWVYGSYQSDVMCIGKHTIIYSDQEGFYCEDEVDPKTVGQFTGLKDKNGKEIYEGDIIKSIRGYKAVVEWADDGRFLGFTIERERKIMYVGQEPAVEVMGNIHDNPELLEVKA